MLKEYILEAVSLLVEAVLGSPVRARASHNCAHLYWRSCYIYYGNCGSCVPGEKKKRYKVLVQWLLCLLSEVGLHILLMVRGTDRIRTPFSIRHKTVASQSTAYAS